MTKINKTPLYILITAFLSIAYSQTNFEIQQAKKIIKEKNLSVDQVKSIAKSKGYSDEQIETAIEKEKRVDNQDNFTPIDNSAVPKTDETFKNLDSQIKDSNLLMEQELDNPDSDVSNSNTQEKYQNQIRMGYEYFGYDIFKQDPKLFQSSNVGVVDPKYLIGPNDEVIIMLWGETQFRQVFKVDREGFIFIPEIGQVFVNGLNLNLLESKLFRVLSQFYESLNPLDRNATTFLDISLGNLRPLRIQVLGHIPQPGIYTVNPNTTLFSSLYYFNGPSILGSLRDIQLIRNGEKVTSIDFYDFLLTGRKLKDYKLQLDDVIYIPKRLKTVTISGEINSPGIYEIKDNETLVDLINISGGLKTTAYLDRAQIDRITPFDKRKEIGMDRMFIDVDLNEYLQTKEKFILNDQDKIEIFSVLNSRQNVVQIYGGIIRPGRYDIGDSLTLSQLIDKSGLLGDAFLDRVDVIRIKNDLTEELIKLDLKKILDGDLEEDIALKDSDFIQVYSTKEMVPNTFINIDGYVKKPGTYKLRSNMTLYDLLFSAGGFNDPEFKKGVYLKRAELIRMDNQNNKKIIPFNLEFVLDEKELSDLPLQPRDQVYIYGLDEIEGNIQYVYIEGFVKSPGRYELYKNNMTIYDLIFKAGGLNDPSHKVKTHLDRADLIRYDEEYENQNIYTFNLGELIKNKRSKMNLNLRPEDVIRVYPKTNFDLTEKITVEGIIKQAGVYNYKIGMNINDLILEAGGVPENFPKYIVEIARKNNLKEKKSTKLIKFELFNNHILSGKGKLDDQLRSKIQKNSEIQLEPFDLIIIRKHENIDDYEFVNVTGEIKYPGKYILKDNDETIYTLIERAGGLDINANSMGSKFIRNGKVIKIDIADILKKRGKSKDNLKLRSGDEIQIIGFTESFEIIGAVNSPGVYKFTNNIRIKEAIENAGGFNEKADKGNIYVNHINGKSLKYKKYFGNHKLFDGSVLNVGIDSSEEINKTDFLKDLTSVVANFVQVISVIILART